MTENISLPMLELLIFISIVVLSIYIDCWAKKIRSKYKVFE